MKADAYLNGQNFHNFLLTPEDMEFTEQGYPIMDRFPAAELPAKLDLIPFNYVKGNKYHHAWVTFYIQDYLFDRCWNSPAKYMEMLKVHPGVIAPDFSLFRDTPQPLQMWSHYKKQWLSVYWQKNGIKVIPNLGWSDEKSFAWCFDGVPENSVVSVSAIGCIKDPTARELFFKGYTKAQAVVKPELVLMHCTADAESVIQQETHVPIRFISYKFRNR